MRRSATLTRLVFVALFLSVAGILGAGVYAFQTDFSALRRSTQENIIWSANQLEFELARFKGTLARFAAGAPDVDTVTVNRRFDVLWSRVPLFESGETGRRLAQYDREGRVAALFAEMQVQDARVVGLAPGDTATALDLVAIFTPHSRRLRELSLAVLHGEEENRRVIRTNVRQSAEMTVYLTVGALALLTVGVMFLFRQNRGFRKLAETNRVLAEEATTANLAKSRFMSMMSHELRTPLNGVLGLLALVKQSGLPRTQLRLVDQAERSGRELTEMLTDVLDYSALADDRQEIEQRPFAMADLAAHIRNDLTPFMQREGGSLDVTCADDLPTHFLGDETRLRKSLSRLSSYIIGTAGAHNLRLDFSLSEDRAALLARISFRYGDDGSGWLPELVLGAPNRESDQFASDALGPAVARLIIERMKGTIEIEPMQDGAFAIRVAVPAAFLEETASDATVLVDASSQMVRWICRAALSPLNLTVHDEPGKPAKGTVVAVLVEAGGEDERGHVAALRRAHPKARMIAIGVPNAADQFSAVVTLQPDPARLREAVLAEIPLRVRSVG